MRRIVLIGAATALLIFASPAGVFAQDGHQQEDKGNGKGHGKPDKEGKDKKRGDEDKAKGDQAAQQQAAQQQALQQQALQQQQAAQQAAQQQAIQQQNQSNQQLRLQQEAQQRIALQQQQAAQYQTRINEQLRQVQTQNALLEQQKRRSQFQMQQQYAAALQQQEQARIQSERNYDYGRDPYYHTAWSYRYVVDGRSRHTNRYGADVLRQAVRYGYEQGLRAGEADRIDHWRFDYRASFVYRDANFGYPGRYVDHSDYNYYFRQGFRRGYEDGYYRRARYGRYAGGHATVFNVVLSGILKLQVIH